jgi:hypothetical protein
MTHSYPISDQGLSAIKDYITPYPVLVPQDEQSHARPYKDICSVDSSVCAIPIESMQNRGRFLRLPVLKEGTFLHTSRQNEISLAK